MYQDTASATMITAGFFVLALRRVYLRVFIWWLRVLFGLGVIEANEKRIIAVPVALGLLLLGLGLLMVAGL